MDFGEYLTESWGNTETEPPVPHAELFTLAELTVQLGSTTIEKIESKLKASKIEYTDVNQTLEDIAKINHITPNQLYEIITKKSEAGMPGSGIGKKTLENLAQENNKDVKDFIEILKANNINATKDQTLKDLADKYDMAARDIYALILGEKE